MEEKDKFEGVVFTETPEKELAVAVLESVLRSYLEPCILYPAISKEDFIKWLRSEDCHFYEALLDWGPNYWHDCLHKAGVFTDNPPQLRAPISIFNFERRKRK